MALRGLLVDYGGVLTSSVAESFGAFCGDEQIDGEVFREVFLAIARSPDSIFARLETGAIEQEEFDAGFASLLGDASGRTIDPAGLKQRLFAGVQPDEVMLEMVRGARAAGVRTALVSNSWGGRDYPPEIIEGPFDATLISGEIGLRKPEPAIYLLAAERLGLEPRACVFVDDLKVNIEGAEAVGMTAILHRDPAETIPLLEQHFGIVLAPDARRAGR